MADTNGNANILAAKRERNYGIDLLRIVSMFMVTLLHLSGYGGFISDPSDGAGFYILSAFRVTCFGAVNIFALISGYVMYGSKIKYSRIIGLWFQVFFYSVGLSVIDEFLVCRKYMLLRSFFPVFTSKFWYFSAYFFMFFFVPFFNVMVEKLSRKIIFGFLTTGFIILCVCSNIERVLADDMFGLLRGYSVMWLSFCYISGASVKKYQSFFYKIPKSIYFFLIILCNASTYICNVIFYGKKFSNGLLVHPSFFLLDYTSPTIFIPAICMLVLFSRLKIKRGIGLIKFFSASAFGVYIIQTHGLVWDNFICKYSSFFDVPSAADEVIIVFFGAVALYLSATIVDYLRIKLFRLLHIDLLSQLICKLFGKVINTAKKPFKKFIQG